jgi:hypothetical protein
MATTPSIVDVYPSSQASGIPIGDSVTVTFDQEMDESSINTGTFVVSGPDTSNIFGPDLTPIEQVGVDDQDSVLSSPYFGGFVEGTITFEKTNASGGSVSVLDQSGAGDQWYTKAIFTPSTPLKPNVEYTILLAGDEDPTNAFDSGVRTRTVFDPTEVSVSGSGTVAFSGGYTGATTRTYVLEITSAGATGVAEYQWWRQSDPLTVYDGATTTGYRELEDGLVVSFGADGSFSVGDQWSVVVVPFIVLPNTYSWTFTTGSGSVLTPPSSSSSSGISLIGSVTTGALQVDEMTPYAGQYGVEISEDPYIGESITIDFAGTSSIDADTVTSDTVSVVSEPALAGLGLTYTGELEATATVSGTTITIALEPGQLYQNNIVTITLDKEIANEAGQTLGEDYISYFSTPYTPLYAGDRRIYLDLGSVLSDVLEETIYLALLEASLAADKISFSTSISNYSFFQHARREYTLCYAEWLLAAGLTSSSGGDRLSKRLGSLSVSRGSLSGLEKLKNDKRDCMAYWEITVKTGGEVTPDASLLPQTTVKGLLSEDSITVGRLWEPISRVGYTPAANTRRGRYNYSSRRLFRTYRKKH